MALDLSSHHLGLDRGENGFAFCQAQAERSERHFLGSLPPATSYSMHSPGASSAVNFSFHFKGLRLAITISLENRRIITRRPPRVFMLSWRTT
jgi:hypothetical protein